MAIWGIALRAIVCCVLALGITPGLISFSAGADPVTQPVPAPPGPIAGPVEPVGQPVVAWPQLGLSDQLVLKSADAQKTVTIPVPDGTTPMVLTGQVEAMSNAVNCRIEVYDSKRQLLGSIVPPEDLNTTPFVLDLSKASLGVASGLKGLELNFALRQDGPPAELCAQTSTPSSITLDRLATGYNGSTPAPTTIADFLPGYLSQVTIRIGSDPSVDLQQTALTLVANLTHLYRPVPVRIDVDTSAAPTPPPADAYGTVRTIAIREDPTAGITVDSPGTAQATLVISGKGDELLQQVELFADHRFEIAQTRSVDITGATEFTNTVSTVKKFGELGMAAQLSVLGTDTMYLGFDASQFGVGPIEGAEVNLLARYTPIGDGEGSVVIRAGSAVLGTYPLDNSGQLDATFQIPADAIQSNVGLALDIRYLPHQGGLPPANRITFFAQPESTVEVIPGTRTRRGFSVLPMAFSPVFNVAVDDPNKIRYAAAAINLLGQVTATTLEPRLTTLEAAVASGSGLLAVASGEELSRRGLKLPLSTTGEDANISGKPATTVDLNGPLGVIETATDDKRTVLAITATQDWNLVDRGFDYIRGLKGQWTALTGDAVVTGALGESVDMTLNQGGGWHDLNPGKGWALWAWISIAVASAAVILGAIFAFVRIRRQRQRSDESEL